MLNVAFIGNGKSTNRYHAPFLLARPEKFRIKTIYGRSAPTWALIPGVEYVSDPEPVWADDEIDLVIITTMTPESHVELTRIALGRGKNVLVEKPFSPTAAEARELFYLAKEKGLFLQGYQNRRFDSDFLTVKEVLDRGVLGDILEVEMHYDYYRPESSYRSPLTTEPGFTFLFGHGVHTIDQALDLFGSPDRIHYDVRQLLGPGRANDYFDVDLYYGTLKVTIGSSFFRLVGRPRFAVYGTKGTFVKATEDRQEEHLKMFAVPGAPGFGVDSPAHYGTLTYMDDDGVFHEEKVVSQMGDYARFYDGIYESLVNGAPKVVKDEETVELIGILEEGVRQGWVPATEEMLAGVER